MGSNRARGSRIAVGMLALALVGVLAGCAHPVTKAGAHTRAASASPAPHRQTTPSPTPEPTLNLSGTARQNFAYFNKVGHALLDHNAAANANGRTIVDYFVQAGFPKKDMEVTPDKTSIGLAAWNIEFSVKFGKSCIIGQAGNVGFNSFVAPVVSTGTCLIGTTRKIDW